MEEASLARTPRRGSLATDEPHLENTLKLFIFALLCAAPCFVFADPVGEAELNNLMIDIGHPSGHRVCGFPGEEKDLIVEYRPSNGKKADEIFTKSGHYLVVEVPGKTKLGSKYYFSGMHVRRGDKHAFDATRYNDPKEWAALLESPEIVKFYFSPKEKNACSWKSVGPK